MIGFVSSYLPLVELAAFNALLAYSQYIVLRAGVFSIATPAFAAVGAYAAAILTVKLGLPAAVGVAEACVLGALRGGLLSFPLARMRGVFQALATLALVQVVMSIALNWTSLTEGALGINGIPKAVGVEWFVVALIAVLYLMRAISISSLGRAFNVVSEDETVAISMGISVVRHHAVAFVLSGLLGGLAGAMHSYSSYSITPNEFGFHMLTLVLAMVVLGGRVSIWGPLAGAVILTGLPELLRGFENYRMVVQGAILMLTIVFLPAGIVDTAIRLYRNRRLSAAAGLEKEIVS